MAVAIPKNADQFTDELIEPLAEVFEKLNNDVVSVITERMNEIGKLNPEEVQMLIASARVSDMQKIEQLIAEAQKISVEEVDKIITESAKYSDYLYDDLYKARQIENLGIANNKVLQSITAYAKKNIEDDILNLTKTAAFVMDGKAKTIRQAYVESVNVGSVAVRTGIMDYQTAIRNQVSKLTKSGIRTVNFQSGYSRRLDSQVRMNVLDGVRQMNQEYRQQQGREFGANGVEISVHFMCAPDHQQLQGRQFTNEQFQILQNTLPRPIGTMNCRHSTFPIIFGISRPRYTNTELKEAIVESNRPVTYKLNNGKEKTVTKYEASQMQRQKETGIRKISEEELQAKNSGDKIMAEHYARMKKENMADYREFSKQVGLKARTNRTKITP